MRAMSNGLTADNAAESATENTTGGTTGRHR